jgi:heme-degrading monooxygenase HmoA
MSVLEVARLSVRSGDEAEFERAFAIAQPLIQNAEGHLGSDLTRSVATGRYVLLVHWNTLEDHVETFVSSPAFNEFHDLLWAHFAEEPTVDHFDEI